MSTPRVGRRAKGETGNGRNGEREKRRKGERERRRIKAFRISEFGFGKEQDVGSVSKGRFFASLRMTREKEEKRRMGEGSCAGRDSGRELCWKRFFVRLWRTQNDGEERS